MKFNNMLSEEEKSAIATLVACGFKAFTEAKLEDVRELDTGKRRRTFRNQGRYQLVLACRNLADRQLPEPEPAAEPVPHEPSATEPDADFVPHEQLAIEPVPLQPVAGMSKKRKG